MRSIPRSRGLIVAAFSIAAAIGHLQADAQQPPAKIKFSLDWVIDGQQSPFLLTHAKGYFTQAGLNVTIDAGAGSGLTVQRVASGTYDMGYGDISSLIEFLGNNPGNPSSRVQAVYMVQESTPAGVMTLRKNHIASPKDLVGRTVGAPVFDSGRKLFPIFAQAQKLDAAGVKWQNVQPGLTYSMLARGQVDAISGFPSFAIGTMETLGVKASEIVAFNYKDYGVQLYGNAILVNPRFMQDHPAAVAAFLRAYNRGLKDTIANPEEGIRYAKQREPLINETAELKRLKALIEFIATPTARSNGLGAVNKLRLENQVADVVRAFGLKSTPNPDQIFNSSFLPPRSERAL